MSLLIDGYNLLHAAGIFPTDGPPTLEGARFALLDYLVTSLPAKELRRTIVVFDAAHAPPGLPREIEHRGLNIRFARRGGSADELLEELIAAEPDPRHLVVVSSDHRVQRAARQRSANYVDSETWKLELDRARSSPSPSNAPPADAEKDQARGLNPFPPGYASDLLRGEDD
jgi:predicted RNA-binding protein with PIN domain